MRVDVHQHLWPDALVDALRSRRHAPRMVGWTLVLDGQPDFAVDPADHDVACRQAQASEDGLDLVLVSLSSPLGIEWLPPEEALPLLDTYHDGVLALPTPFLSWASVCLSEIDPAQAGKELGRGCVGLQLPATAVLDAQGYERCASLLDLLETHGRPLFVHPGAAPLAARRAPAWWPALVPYVQQMHAAWFAFRAFGRPRHPRLRVCFAMLAGLAPLHGERLRARGGDRGTVDPEVFVESSSYGTRAVDAMVRVLGVDAVVLGSDRPYALPSDPGLGAAAAHAIRTTNPTRFLDLQGAMG
ncbi:MAG TPA: amidohydrolase [Actinomycetes bacterium]|jgi:hypothetical protein|nr:amidohydrolase [Actinomycetes bacterium]